MVPNLLLGSCVRSHLLEPIFKPRTAHRLHARDDERAARGKAARERAPRSRHAELHLAPERSPIELLVEQERSRLPDLVAIRHARMAQSPFAFYRGAALIMASDLAQTPTSGLHAQLCGDAHLVNFGMFGTPERQLIFDVNDFDETLAGPWEWDLKRLVTSIEIAGRDRGHAKRDRHAAVADTVRCYRQTMVELAAEGNLGVWYACFDVDTAMSRLRKLLNSRQRAQASHTLAKAEIQDSVRELAKLTERRDGAPRIVGHPPLIVPLADLVHGAQLAEVEAELARVLDNYKASLIDERRTLLDQYRLVEIAHKVVGVGSVGTRCWIALLLGIDGNDPLFLQIKEADASVLERFLGPSPYAQHGERVVAGQRLMQAASDALLGWVRDRGIDGVPRDFYVRQLRDWKGSVAVDELQPEGMSLYGRMCAWTLARAHARSGDRVAIAAYLGSSDRFDDALVTFADAYADQNERDHDALLRAIRSGALAAAAAES